MVIQAVLIKGEIPLRSGESFAVDDRLWNLCTMCWNKTPGNRPTAIAALDLIRATTDGCIVPGNCKMLDSALITLRLLTFG